MELRVLKVSFPILMLMAFQTGNCGIFGELARLDRQMTGMTPQQQIRADEEFWAGVEGRPVQPAPAPAPAPQPMATPAQTAPAVHTSFAPTAASTQSSMAQQPAVHNIPQGGDFGNSSGQEVPIVTVNLNDKTPNADSKQENAEESASAAQSEAGESTTSSVSNRTGKSQGSSKSRGSRKSKKLNKFKRFRK